MAKTKKIVYQNQQKFDDCSVEVNFSVYAPNAASVAVAGNFNGWKQLDLARNEYGYWSVKTKLNKGAYQYKFVFDNRFWEPDKANYERIADGYGGHNSIKRV